jgi:hypothetical protein
MAEGDLVRAPIWIDKHGNLADFNPDATVPTRLCYPAIHPF